MPPTPGNRVVPGLCCLGSGQHPGQGSPADCIQGSTQTLPVCSELQGAGWGGRGVGRGCLPWAHGITGGFDAPRQYTVLLALPPLTCLARGSAFPKGELHGSETGSLGCSALGLRVVLQRVQMSADPRG